MIVILILFCFSIMIHITSINESKNKVTEEIEEIEDCRDNR